MSVAHSGHLYAMTRAAKNLTPAAQISELFGGMSQVCHSKESCKFYRNPFLVFIEA